MVLLSGGLSGGLRTVHLCVSKSWFLESVNMTPCGKMVFVDLWNEGHFGCVI